MDTQRLGFQVGRNRHSSVTSFLSVLLLATLMFAGGIPSNASAEVSLAGVHWYSGDRDMLDEGYPRGSGDGTSRRFRGSVTWGQGPMH